MQTYAFEKFVGAAIVFMALIMIIAHLSAN